MSTIIQTILEKLRTYFLMQQEIAAADQRLESTDRTMVAAAKMARSLLGAAESLEDVAEREPGAVALIREALLFANRGLAHQTKLEFDPDDAISTWHAVAEMPDVKRVLASLSAESREKLEQLLKLGLSADQADWSASEWHVLKQSFIQVARRCVQLLEDGLFESRRLRFLRMQRWLVVGGALCALIGWQWWNHKASVGGANLALNKKVTTSSDWRTDLYPPQGLVDGDKTRMGCHTNTERYPWALIDLGRTKTVHRVVVTNRLDGLPERAVPLLVEISVDGTTYTEFARKTEVFTTWTADHSSIKGRYVRVTAMNDTVLHLNEIEVY